MSNRKTLAVALTTAFLFSASPARACCGDGEIAAGAAVKAGYAMSGAIYTSAATIEAWLERLTMTIASGFGKVVAEIMKQTAAQRVMAEGMVAVQTQNYWDKVNGDRAIKYEVSDRACYESAGGTAASVAAGETREAVADLGRKFAARSLYTPNATAALGKIYTDHQDKYCSQQDADLGRCRPAPAQVQNADIRADLSLNVSRYTPEQAEAAQALINNLANPTPTQNLPKDLEKTKEGQTYVALQNVEQARLSVAANSLNNLAASRLPIKGLGSAAMLNQPDVSENDLIESQIRGRFESSSWHTMLVGFSLENLFRELNKQEALKLYMQLKDLQRLERIEMVLATSLALDVEKDARQRDARAASLKTVRN